MIAHKDIPNNDNHHPFFWIFNTATERLSTTVLPEDLYKRAIQLDNEKEYTLISVSPIRWLEQGISSSIITTTVARLNPSPIINVIPGLSLDTTYSCLTLTSAANVTLVSTPNIRGPINNAQEITLINIGNYSITFQSELNLTGSQIGGTDFTLSPNNRVAKLVFIKSLGLWYKY